MAHVWTAIALVTWLISGTVTQVIFANEMLCSTLEEVNPDTNVRENILDCERRNLDRIPEFKSGNKVDKLLLGGNQITKIPNDAFKGISPFSIDLHGNIINSMEENAFRGVEDNLKTLNLSSNQLKISNIKSVLKLTALETLDLDDNSFRDKVKQNLPRAAFKGLDNLKKLMLSGNQIKSLNKTFLGLRELRHLDLRNNKLTSLGNSLGGLKNLQALDLSSNNLRHFPRDDLRDLSGLSELFLHGNKIKRFPEGAFNKISQIQRLSLCTASVNVLDSKNASVFTPIEESLKHLDLSDCSLGSAPVEMFKVVRNLQSLDISSTKIKQLHEGTFRFMSNLQELNIGSNPITLSPGILSGLENSLKELNVENLGLKTIPSALLETLKALEKLAASSNSFTEISDKALKGVPAWKYEFRRNNIKTISPNGFASALKPLELDLRHNKIEKLDFVADGCRFSFIDVSENPITCDCSVLELKLYEDLEILGTCEQTAQYKNLEIESSDFQDKASKACNHNKTKIVYCNLDESGNPTGGSSRDGSKTALYFSLIASVLIQALSVWLFEL